MQISNPALPMSDMEWSPQLCQDVLELPLLYASGSFASLDRGEVTLTLNGHVGECPAIPRIAACCRRTTSTRRIEHLPTGESSSTSSHVP